MHIQSQSHHSHSITASIAATCDAVQGLNAVRLWTRYLCKRRLCLRNLKIATVYFHNGTHRKSHCKWPKQTNTLINLPIPRILRNFIKITEIMATLWLSYILMTVNNISIISINFRQVFNFYFLESIFPANLHVTDNIEDVFPLKQQQSITYTDWNWITLSKSAIIKYIFHPFYMVKGEKSVFFHKCKSFFLNYQQSISLLAYI